MAQVALVLGSSFSAAPMVQRLLDAGWHVETCGSQPADPCVAWGHQHHLIDYSDAAEIAKLLEQRNFDALIPTSNDSAYRSAAYACVTRPYLGVDTIAQCELVSSKDAFRELLFAHGIPAPRTYSREELAGREMAIDVLVKPVDSWAGRGCSRVTDPAYLEQSLDAARAASASGRVVIDEFVEGSLHSHSAFFLHGAIYCDFLVDEFCETYPYQVDCSNHPSGLPAAAHAQAKTVTQMIANALGVTDGLLHTQLLYREGLFYVVESMRRCPGDLFPELIAKSTGFDYASAYLSAFTGEPLPKLHLSSARCIVRHTLSSRLPGIFWSCQPLPNPVPKVQFYPLAGSGSRVQPAPFGKIGIAFAELESREQMHNCVRRASEFLDVKSTPSWQTIK